MQAHLDGAVGQPESPRDRLLGEILVVAEVQKLAVAIVKAFERGVEVGPLHRGNQPLVLGALFFLDLGDGVRPHARVKAEGLVANDRPQPLFAAAGIAQGGAAPPGPQEGFLGDVLGLAGIARVTVRQAYTETVRLLPVPAVVVIRILSS